MFVLGIDPGLTRTGYGVVAAERGSVRAIAAGVVRTDTAAPIADRLAELHRDLATVVRDHAPSQVAIEQVFVNQNRRTAISVARASGVALLVAGQAGLPVTEYTPSAVKMALVGYGNADKQQVQRVIAMRLGIDAAPKPADAADALAVALCHLQASHLHRLLERAP
jgi:crossover junction endodeoxyribonuclease RuvC